MIRSTRGALPLPLLSVRMCHCTNTPVMARMSRPAPTGQSASRFRGTTTGWATSATADWASAVHSRRRRGRSPRISKELRTWIFCRLPRPRPFRCSVSGVRQTRRSERCSSPTDHNGLPQPRSPWTSWRPTRQSLPPRSIRRIRLSILRSTLFRDRRDFIHCGSRRSTRRPETPLRGTRCPSRTPRLKIWLRCRSLRLTQNWWGVGAHHSCSPMLQSMRTYCRTANCCSGVGATNRRILWTRTNARRLYGILQRDVSRRRRSLH